MATPFKARTGMLGATEPFQKVTTDNVHHLPCGSVVRLIDSDGVLVHLHGDLWYYRSGCAWCYDKIEHLSRYLPGILCHHP
jgi:hypothetical protein